MDNLTHTLMALVLARTLRFRSGQAGLPPYATPALVMAANLPDLDYLAALGGPPAYLEYRYAGAHSLAGAAVLAAGGAALVWSLARRRQPPLTRSAGLKLWLVCLLGTASHSLMDWASAYGTELLWPFRRDRYALDWFASIDLWLLVILLLGLALPALFRLISEEIGAQRSETGARWGAWVALAACALLAAGRASLHADAVGQLEARLYRGRSPLRAGAFPTPLSPFQWNGVVETDTTFEAGELDQRPGRGPGGESFTTFYKPASLPALEAALSTPTAERFLAWARFPHAEVSPTANGWQIRLRDLRFAAGARPRVTAIWMELNPELELRAEGAGEPRR